jgi:hypothetical protein
VSAVAVSVYLVDVVSFPSTGVATTFHLPAASARFSVGAGAGVGVAAAALVVSAACSLLLQALTAMAVSDRRTSVRCRESFRSTS